VDGFKDTTRMRNMEGGSCFAHGGAVKAPMSKGGLMKKRYGGDVTRGAVDRGNRMSAEEAGESRISTERAPRRVPRSMGPSPQQAGAAEPTSALSRKLSVLPSERGEIGPMTASERRMMRGSAGASYRNNPLIPDVIEEPLRRAGVLNRKAGGLATMPRGKK
jgi:hypothetical protein